MKHLFVLCILVFVGFTAQSQYFSWGTEPASIRWKQIQTDNFQVITPKYR